MTIKAMTGIDNIDVSSYSFETGNRINNVERILKTSNIPNLILDLMRCLFIKYH
jgi:hypothetical protein